MQVTTRKKGNDVKSHDITDDVAQLIKREKENVLKMATKVDYSFLK